nr:hypothetical protein [Tanacetum cinerariifolium]
RKAEEWCYDMSKVVEGRRGKKVLVVVAKGRRTTKMVDRTVVGLGYEIPKSRYILDITSRKSYYSLSVTVHQQKKLFFELRFMALDGSDQNARYALSKLLQRGTVAEYERKKLNIKEKIDIILSWPSEEAPLVIKGSLDANEDIGVVEVLSVIDDVFDIGESNVKSIEVRSEFSEFLENKESVKEVVVGGGEFDGRLDEINLNLSEELAENGGNVIFEGGRSVTAWVAEGERMVLCYVQGSGGGRGKKVLVMVAEGRRTTEVVDRTVPSEEAPLVIKGSLDANEDIGVVEVLSVIDDVFDIGESNVESIEVRSEFSKFLENKESVKEVVVGGGEFDGRLDEINLNLSKELAENGVIFEGGRSVTAWVAEGGRMVLCYVQGSGGGRGKKVLVVIAEGRRTTEVVDGTMVGLGYEIPESRYILDITLRTRW